MNAYCRNVRLLLATAAVPQAAYAQDASAGDVERELASMRAAMAQMAARIESLEGQLAEEADNAAATAIVWKGAPEFTAEGGWSFKPRGRLQLDAGTVGAPNGIADEGLGFASEVRRAYLGFDGRIPGGFGYRAEIDVAASEVEITDLYLTYNPSKTLTLTLGQHKPFWGLEEMTSDLFPSFVERAAVNTAFGYERRLGASAAYASGDAVVQGGLFTDHVQDLNDDGNKAWSADARAVYMPKLAGGQLHLGASAHYRELGDSAASVRYRVRPMVHTSDVRFIDTGAIMATSETGYGLEAGFIAGPFHAAAEAHWQQVERIAGTDPTFFGGYAEAGLFLTKGDSRGYKGGVFERVKPVRPLGEGGAGAIQVNVRYDYLDLVDAGIVGGSQNAYQAALIWTPTGYTRLIATYGRLHYDHAAVPAAGGDRSYGVDAFGLRAQVDF